MIVYITMTIIVMLVALCIKQHSGFTNDNREYVFVYKGIGRQSMLNKVSMVIIFTVLFGVSALRLNVGNDYSKYVEFMHLTYSNSYVPTEIGFNYLTKAVYTLFGYENYVFVFAVFSFATVAFFLAAIWEQSDNFYMSLALFMMLGYYFQSLSTVRYYLALGIALYSIRFVINRDWPKFVFLAIIGACFHKSMILILVLYPLAAMKWKRWMIGAAGVVCLSCVFLNEIYLDIALKLYPTYEDTDFVADVLTDATGFWSTSVGKFVYYLVHGGGTSLVSIGRCLAVLILAYLIFHKKRDYDRRLSFYYFCNVMALALYVFGCFLPTISRIAYYLTITQILYVPALIERVTDDKYNKALKALVYVGCLGYFIMYMRSAGNDGIRILPYETFLFHDLPATLSERGFG